MSSKPEFALVTPSKESEARPLVVLLAWLGARRRHVRVYSRLLERNDVQSLTVIGDPNDTIMGRLDNIHDLAKRVIAHLQKEFPGRRIVLAPFSNGGCYVYEYMRVELAKDPTAINLSGVIFDSAPAAITAVSGAVACGKLYKQGSVASLAAYWVSYAFFALMLGITDRSAAFKDRIESFPAICPEMYVWSREDTITDPEWVEQVIAKRAALDGADVRSARFHGSEHVLHYKHSPRAFTKVWRDFFQDKLGETLPAEAEPSDEGSASRSASFRKAAEEEHADACSVVDVKA
ncbi:hypothetical protein FNF31_04379 [Cafeteria roenbergensis]|uniref:Serine hydrolase FSH domain-containing protein n=1 Tax=Cafeteria roenbergensis TaxID=33653 RepID=A0A5A8D4F3_CAFRO|nr:hypothetical protein FNF31_04379 [Cafeteria roenbergensis]